MESADPDRYELPVELDWFFMCGAPSLSFALSMACGWYEREGCYVSVRGDSKEKGFGRKTKEAEKARGVAQKTLIKTKKEKRRGWSSESVGMKTTECRVRV